jgi:DNA-binding Lrp family transcriptional regulator
MDRTADEIDRAILFHAKESWQKVAMIIARSQDQLGDMTDGDLPAVLQRIKALVADGKLEGAGNLDRPRHSEVRLAGRDDKVSVSHDEAGPSD